MTGLLAAFLEDMQGQMKKAQELLHLEGGVQWSLYSPEDAAQRIVATHGPGASNMKVGGDLFATIRPCEGRVMNFAFALGRGATFIAHDITVQCALDLSVICISVKVFDASKRFQECFTIAAPRVEGAQGCYAHSLFDGQRMIGENGATLHKMSGELVMDGAYASWNEPFSSIPANLRVMGHEESQTEIGGVVRALVLSLVEEGKLVESTAGTIEILQGSLYDQLRLQDYGMYFLKTN